MADPAERTGRWPQLAKYEVVEEIGHGGMATVYRARDVRLGRDVAIKLIHPHLRDSREAVHRFNTEARAVAKLRHRNIVEVYDVSGADEPEQYLVVELVRGTTLRKLIQERGPMPPEVAAAVALELLEALGHAHEVGVVHRDVKPENVLIERSSKKALDAARPEGDWARVAVKLTDFGIAKLLDAQGVTSTGQVLGSPAHMAPEQIEGGAVGPQADVFGLGVLLYECMVGHLPFEGSSPAQVLRRVLEGIYPEAVRARPTVGKRWSGILDRALAHMASDRFADAATMRRAVLQELDRLGISSAEGELARWMDEPAEYSRARAKELIDRLCVLGSESRKAGDVLSAAADYNRALALSPYDPQLLRIVSGMAREQRVAKWLGRAAAVIALVMAICATVVFARRAREKAVARPGAATLSLKQTSSPLTPSSDPSPGAMPSTSPAVASTPVLSPSRTAVESTQSPHSTPVPPAVALREPPRLERALTLDLKPPMGVSVSIDGQANREVTTGDKLTLDAKAHALVFSCPRRGGGDPCVAVRVAVPAGDKDDTVVLSVPVKPATLVVEGDANRSYQVQQHPEIVVRAGANIVPLRSAYEPITVQEIETGVAVPVRLEAGGVVKASFR